MKDSLIIRPGELPNFIKPGLHSHNTGRRIDAHPSRYRVLRFVSSVLFCLGLCGIAYFGYALSDQYVYQAYENWAFDQKIAGHQVTFGDYVRERTPFGFLTGEQISTAKIGAPQGPQRTDAQPAAISRPLGGSVLGRLQITRLNLSAIVREGVDQETLSRAVGHLPYTALPGQTGNFAIAAHRDTLFRVLKDIRKDDRITFRSPIAIYNYEVISTKIVKPSDLSVVQPEGSNKLLTMITCYPFYYVGSAPKRFIVQAKLIETEGASQGVITQPQNMRPPPTGGGVKSSVSAAQPKAAGSADSMKPRRTQGFSHLSRSGSGHSSTVPSTSRTRRKKSGFWHKLVHPKQS